MYRAPLRELRFVLEELLGARVLAEAPALADYSDELARSVLEEAARFAENVLDPLNRPGDTTGARWTPEGVVAAPGFREAYQQFVAGGWPALGSLPEFGGQRVPRVLVSAVGELWGSANLAFKLGPMLTHGAVHALELCGSPEQKARYLPRMVRGEWSGTMVLTEPQAGSDLGQVRTRAVPEGDHYRLFGQKIFITWGDHDLTDNTIHMVLGRIEGAPPGVKGISLFIVPKVLVNADGSLGARNEVRCLSIEHKLGIHASPTCVLAFGEKQGAIAYLVGEPGRGLEYMFIMMNSARLSVGSEGYAVGERAFQRAAEWARTRVQGRPPAAQAGAPLPIINHPDVKRMLLMMKAQTQASRALTLYTAFQFDLAEFARDAARRDPARSRGELLTPIVKGWCTEIGNEVAAMGVQVHGGMGFIEETGAAQYMRDVRITTIYEGTTGIQANDLIGRKVGRDGGAALTKLIDEIRAELERLPRERALQPITGGALEGITQLATASRALIGLLGSQPAQAAAVAVPFLKLCGFALGGWLLARAAGLSVQRLGGAEREFHAAKLETARFYAEQILPRTLALGRIVERGGASVVEASPARV
jgi:3-(methylthio)propanoyl-CoA dehydrogenase